MTLAKKLAFGNPRIASIVFGHIAAVSDFLIAQIIHFLHSPARCNSPKCVFAQRHDTKGARYDWSVIIVLGPGSLLKTLPRPKDAPRSHHKKHSQNCNIIYEQLCITSCKDLKFFYFCRKFKIKSFIILAVIRRSV